MSASRSAGRCCRHIGARSRTAFERSRPTWRRSTRRSRSTRKWRYAMQQVLEQTRLERGRAMLAEVAMDKDTGRYRRGMAVLRQVGGEGYDEPIRALQDIAPALNRFTVEFAYGDVMDRPALDLKTRELCTVAALAALDCRGAAPLPHRRGTQRRRKPARDRRGTDPSDRLRRLPRGAERDRGGPRHLPATRRAAGRTSRVRPEKVPGDRYARGMETLERMTTAPARRSSRASPISRRTSVASSSSFPTAT